MPKSMGPRPGSEAQHTYPTCMTLSLSSLIHKMGIIISISRLLSKVNDWTHAGIMQERVPLTAMTVQTGSEKLLGCPRNCFEG